MKIIGLTGGIGSGKTTIAKMFEALGVPIYYADDEAKKLMHTSLIIRMEVSALFGEEAYNEFGLNRKFIASIVFAVPEKLKALNAIVHPEVAKHFLAWAAEKERLNFPYVLKENAILFESGGDKDCDMIITVIAGKEERIQRVMKRDTTTRKEVLQRIANQWEDSLRISKSDFVLNNNSIDESLKKVKDIHKIIIN